MKQSWPRMIYRKMYLGHFHMFCIFTPICGVEVYDNTRASYLDKLTKLNNKIIRIRQKKRTQ